MSKKSILITGSNGLLGTKLLEHLSSGQQFAVTASSLGKNRNESSRDYEYVSLDIGDPEMVDKVLGSLMPSFVINTAAMTNVDACESEQALCDRSNIEGVRNLVDSLRSLAEKHSGYDPFFLQLSTDFVFNGNDGPYAEDASPDPLSYYAKSKVISEQITINSGIRWAIARTIIIYGYASHLSRSNLVLWVKNSLEKGQSINVVDDQFRSPTLAEDLADGCIRIIERESMGIFHLSGPHTMSILEIANRVADFWKLDKSLIRAVSTSALSQAAKRPPKTGFILDKARSVLGYKPHTLEEGLAVLDSQLRKAGSGSQK
jgi:dTDP-4-dehydrorhamnose reductase